MDKLTPQEFAKQIWQKQVYLNGKPDFQIKFSDGEIFYAQTEILKQLAYFKDAFNDTKCTSLDFGTEPTTSFTKKVFSFLYDKLKQQFLRSFNTSLTLDDPIDQLEYIKLLDYLTDPNERPVLLKDIEFSGMFWVGMVTNQIGNVETFFNDHELDKGFKAFIACMKENGWTYSSVKELEPFQLYFRIIINDIEFKINNRNPSLPGFYCINEWRCRVINCPYQHLRL